MNFLAELRHRLNIALTGIVPDPSPYVDMLKPTQDAKFGDFQANCAMPLKAVLNQPPREIAEQIVARLDVADLCDPPTIAGPGFINLRIRDDCLAAATAKLLPDDRLGVPVAATPKTFIVDFSAPNVAKPMHVGHLRSTVIGNALYQTLKFLGHRVIGDNHIGDWGTQFGMMIYG
jgi:arginyl-tRNA synthetase